MSNPRVNEEKIIHPAEHEIWLSFNGDDDATLFYEWWGVEGEKLYQKYCEECGDIDE